MVTLPTECLIPEKKQQRPAKSFYQRALRILPICLLAAAGATAQKPQQFSLQSPDKSITVNLLLNEDISYTVTADGQQLVAPSRISFSTDQLKPVKIAAAGLRVKKSATKLLDEQLTPVVFQKSGTVRNYCQQLQLELANGLTLEWRVFNEGFAWRWLTSHKGAYKVLSEEANWQLPAGARSWYPLEDGFYSHNERLYKYLPMDSITEQKLASLPALFEIKNHRLLLTESSLFNYAGCWLRGNGNGGLKAVFPYFPKEKKITSDRDEKIQSREDFIALGNGPQAYPWRVAMVAREDKQILTNQLPYLLGRPAEGDFSWVKPGKVQWDWWHANNVYGVPFKAGVNNDTYKYYIDFAAEYNIEYVLLDEGWCDTRDLMKQVPDINVQELARYAREKKVDLLLWTSWLVLDKQLEVALDSFASWGIKGIKVDFMQRDDQEMVNYYEKVAKAAAARHLLVDFHGAYKPTGWLRTYPNILTSEGVFGNENSKWSKLLGADHNTTLPFIRMAAGPMDFTPGGMLNAQEKYFAPIWDEPLTQGTRCNQLAMYVIYESPLQMLCDMPTHYYKEPEAMEFLRAVPVEWTQTIPLHAKTGDYVAMARQARNGDWFVGAMTDWDARELQLNLSFLPEGSYRMEILKDGVNANQNAKDFAKETLTVTKNTTLTMPLAKGGGYVARITKQ